MIDDDYYTFRVDPNTRYVVVKLDTQQYLEQLRTRRTNDEIRKEEGRLPQPRRYQVETN